MRDEEKLECLNLRLLCTLFWAFGVPANDVRHVTDNRLCAVPKSKEKVGAQARLDHVRNYTAVSNGRRQREGDERHKSF
jgi:hypothetical protein